LGYLNKETGVFTALEAEKRKEKSWGTTLVDGALQIVGDAVGSAQMLGDIAQVAAIKTVNSLPAPVKDVIVPIIVGSEKQFEKIVAGATALVEVGDQTINNIIQSLTGVANNVVALYSQIVGSFSAPRGGGLLSVHEDDPITKFIKWLLGLGSSSTGSGMATQTVTSTSPATPTQTPSPTNTPTPTPTKTPTPTPTITPTPSPDKQAMGLPDRSGTYNGKARPEPKQYLYIPATIYNTSPALVKERAELNARIDQLKKEIANLPAGKERSEKEKELNDKLQRRDVLERGTIHPNLCGPLAVGQAVGKKNQDVNDLYKDFASLGDAQKQKLANGNTTALDDLTQLFWKYNYNADTHLNKEITLGDLETTLKTGDKIIALVNMNQILDKEGRYQYKVEGTQSDSLIKENPNYLKGTEQKIAHFVNVLEVYQDGSVPMVKIYNSYFDEVQSVPWSQFQEA